jgi:hypothetical protein
MKINQVVVMYLDTDQIVRPVTPPDVSPVIGILSCYSFLFLDTVGLRMVSSHVVGLFTFLDVCTQTSLSGRKSSSLCCRVKV